MTRNRFIAALSVAAAAAAVVLLLPRIEGESVPLGSDLLTEAAPTSEPKVPWPSPPSASPVTPEPPALIEEPSDPQAAAVFRAVNERRVEIGLPYVLLDGTLNEVARLHAEDMAARTYLDHSTPEGITFQMRLDATGYAYESAAENLGFASHVDLIVPDWIRSTPHRVNIENGTYRRVGVATAKGKWQGINVIYAAMVFADPR